ncbi:hypothetical protein BC936DRAFT_146583, partial [Jimgerdemannia flammicorona]
FWKDSETYEDLCYLAGGTALGLYILLRSGIVQPLTTYSGYLTGNTTGNITLVQDTNNYFSTPDYALRLVYSLAQHPHCANGTRQPNRGENLKEFQTGCEDA